MEVLESAAEGAGAAVAEDQHLWAVDGLPYVRTPELRIPLGKARGRSGCVCLFRCVPKTSHLSGKITSMQYHYPASTRSRRKLRLKTSFNRNKERGHHRQTFFKHQIGLKFSKAAETNQLRTGSHLPQTSGAVAQIHAAFTMLVEARALPGVMASTAP